MMMYPFRDEAFVAQLLLRKYYHSSSMPEKRSLSTCGDRDVAMSKALAKSIPKAKAIATHRDARDRVARIHVEGAGIDLDRDARADLDGLMEIFQLDGDVITSVVILCQAEAVQRGEEFAAPEEILRCLQQCTDAAIIRPYKVSDGCAVHLTADGSAGVLHTNSSADEAPAACYASTDLLPAFVSAAAGSVGPIDDAQEFTGELVFRRFVQSQNPHTGRIRYNRWHKHWTTEDTISSATVDSTREA
jgi:hypothetical protein